MLPQLSVDRQPTPQAPTSAEPIPLTQLRRCCATVAIRRGRSTPCGCVYHPAEITRPGGVEHAPCGHPVAIGGVQRLDEQQAPYFAQPTDIERWQREIAGRLAMAGFGARLSAEIGAGWTPTTPAGAAYYALWHVQSPEEAQAWVIACNRAVAALEELAAEGQVQS